MLLYDSKLSSPLHSLRLRLSKCCAGLSLSRQAFLLLHAQLACRQQPDLVCAVLALMELCFAQVSNANLLLLASGMVAMMFIQLGMLSCTEAESTSSLLLQKRWNDLLLLI